jgi:hypothetical protein
MRCPRTRGVAWEILALADALRDVVVSALSRRHRRLRRRRYDVVSLVLEL